MSLLDTLQRGGWLREVDVALAQTLARRAPETTPAVQLGAALASRAIAAGHSLIDLSQAADFLAATVADREPPALPREDDWLAQLRTSRWVDSDARPRADAVLHLHGTQLQLRRYADFESRLAAALRARAASAMHALDGDDTLRIVALFPPGERASEQAQAAHAALSHPLLLLTGGPGTGKTTTVARLLVLLVERALRRGEPAPRIALAAPTGKAAARAIEALRDALSRIDPAPSEDVHAALPTQARTLHRLLGVIPHSTQFRHDAGHPLDADVVVVDEASMVDLPLMTRLVEAVPPHARLLLVGDADQLPSVEAGDVLRALCDATGEGDALHGRRVHLARGWRASASLQTAPLADAVRAGDADGALALLSSGTLSGVTWRDDDEAALLRDVVASAVDAYAAVASSPSPQEALARARGFRVLTALREGASGSVALNARIAAGLAPPGASPDLPFHGRLLMVTANSYRHGLFNGDVGIVWRDADDTPRVWFETEDGLRAWSPAALPAHRDAWALTVHKAQGSEFDRVWLVLPARDARVCSRELLYTGLTRARREVTLGASRDVLRAAIERRAQRWSGLHRHLASPPDADA